MFSRRLFIGMLVCLGGVSGGIKAADIEAILPSSDSSSGFAIKNSEGNTLFKVTGDTALTLATSISETHLSTAARQTQSVEDTAKTSAYAMTNQDGVILADPSGGAFTVTLPQASGAKGRTHSLVISGDGNTVTLDGKDNETINGGLTKSLSSKGTSLTVISDGSNWHSLKGAASLSNSSGLSIGKTAIVAATGGNYTSPNDAVTNLASWCGTPSSSNPCLIYIAPGHYTLTAPLDLSSHSYVSVAGSGEKATVLEMVDNIVLQAADESEIRDITIVGSGDTFGAIGILANGDTVLNRVTVKMSAGNSSFGVINTTGAFTANDVTITNVDTTSMGVTTLGAAGVSLNNVNISVEGTGSKGYVDQNSIGPIQIKNSTIAATGDAFTAMELSIASPFVVVRESSFSSQSNIGLTAVFQAASTLHINNIDVRTGSSLVPAFEATASLGASGAVLEVQNSRFSASVGTGFRTSVLTARIANSLVEGSTPLALLSGTLNCFDVYDRFFSPIAGTSVCSTNNHDD